MAPKPTHTHTLLATYPGFTIAHPDTEHLSLIAVASDERNRIPCHSNQVAAGMATPASSATTPSPPMAYLSHTPLSEQSPGYSPVDVHEHETRKKTVQKFLARAEMSMVTRALRARLAYASYKATHNVSNVPLRELEGRLASQNQAASYNRTITAKRKAAGTSSTHLSSAASIPGSSIAAIGASSARRGVNSAVPSPISSPRVNQSAANGFSASMGHRSSPANKASGPSLYASVLAPPSTLAARTILNATDSPLPASSRSAPSPRVRAVKASPKSAANSSRTHVKAKQPDKKAVSSPVRRKAKRVSLEKGKQKQHSMDLGDDGDVDMKAAATLTSLLLNRKSSIAGSISSPRSSIDGSEVGSAYSHSHYAQSSARSTTAASPPVSISSMSTLTGESSFRHQTPPPGPPTANVHQTTPRPSTTDNEAADLMLYLATSPSPARPTPKERDPSTYRSLNNDASTLRSKGRILFPTSSGEVSLSPIPSTNRSRGPKPPTKTGDDGFILDTTGSDNDASIKVNADTHAVRSPSSAASPGQLLPPPSLPTTMRFPESPSIRKNTVPSPKTIYGSGASDFNFHEYINASPSPLRSAAKPSLNLRADIGRKLFEEEQLRHSMGVSQSPTKRPSNLDAGIDIIPS